MSAETETALSESARALLVDASPFIFRFYFALPSSMSAPDGRPINATYGFAGFLLQLREQCAPDRGLVAFDGSLTTSFRNEIYPEYKAQRELPPPELEEQQALCREVAAALGFPVEVDARYEADDLVASAHRWLVEQLSVPSRVVTSDKDLCQLVDERTWLWDFARDQLFDPGAVRGKFGVGPEQLLDWQALAGDAVDNIPGVKGVGAKTAAALLGELGSLDAALADLEAVASLPVRGAKSLARKLEEQREQALLSRELAAMVGALDRPAWTEKELAMEPVDGSRWQNLCDDLGFDRIAARGLALADEPPPA